MKNSSFKWLQFVHLLLTLKFTYLIIELVGKGAATVWLQQTKAVDFPLNKPLNKMPMQ